MASKDDPIDIRRWLALAVAIVMFCVAGVVWSLGSTDSSQEFLMAACARIGLVMFALWLAWPSLKRPAKWLPASAPVIGVVALIVIAAQPRLILPAIPIVGGLIAFSAFVRAFRKHSKDK